MNNEIIELKIYEEYKKKVEAGFYNGKVVMAELKSGDYLKNMECIKKDPELFIPVAKKIKKEMEAGFFSEIEKAPFFVRGPLEKAKYGETLYAVSINKNIIKSVSKRMRELENTLKSLKLVNNLSNILSRNPSKQSNNSNSFGVGF